MRYEAPAVAGASHRLSDHLFSAGMSVLREKAWPLARSQPSLLSIAQLIRSRRITMKQNKAYRASNQKTLPFFSYRLEKSARWHYLRL